METSGGAGAGEEPHQVKKGGHLLERPPACAPPPTHQSNRILSAQTGTLLHSVCGNASAPLVGFHPAKPNNAHPQQWKTLVTDPQSEKRLSYSGFL